MRKLILHVGVHRTGTTSIQKFMRENFSVLLQKGVLYPFGVRRHDGVVQRLLSGEVSAEALADDLDRRAATHRHSLHSILLSDEDISMIRDPAVFEPLTERYEVKVIMALRRQDLWLESWYQQNIKWQWNPHLAHLTFDEFYEKRGDFFWIDYAARIAAYEAIFGKGAVVPMVFEKGAMPEGLIQTFLRLLGVEDLSGFGPFLHSNSSLSPLMSEVVRQLPMDKMPGKERALVEAACMEVDRTLGGKTSNLLMSRNRREEVMADYEQSNLATAQQYFGRDVLFHEPLPSADAPLADLTLPEGASEVIARFMGPILGELASLLTAARIEREAREKALKW